MSPCSPAAGPAPVSRAFRALGGAARAPCCNIFAFLIREGTTVGKLNKINRIKSWLFWPFVFLAGLLLYELNAPAGWLLGSLIGGAFFRFFVAEHRTDPRLFSAALAFIGLSLGAALDVALLWDVLRRHFWSIAFCLLAILCGGIALGLIFHKVSGIDRKTAILSFIPGGFSEVVSVSDRVEADTRVIASFHTARIIMFVIVFPLLAGAERSRQAAPVFSGAMPPGLDFVLPVAILLVAVFAANFFLRLPSGILLYAAVFACVWSWFLPLELPSIAVGIAQVVVGASIGLKFDKETFRTLKNVGASGLLLLVLLGLYSFGTGIAFSFWTKSDFWSSVFSWVPAGAAEFASTALLMNLDAQLVIALQMIRVYCVIFCLPLVAWALKK